MASRGLGIALRTRFYSSSTSTAPSASTATDVSTSGIGVQGFLKAVGKGVEAHADKVAQKVADFPTFLRLRRGWFKDLGIPCQQRKLIMRHTEKYKQGLWKPKVSELKKLDGPAGK